MNISQKKEIFSLYTIQVANMILPLLAFTYIANILGVAGLGKIAFYQTINTLCCFVVDFGFTMSAARSLSLNLNNKSEIDTIYVNVQFCKFFIWVGLNLIFLIYFLIQENLNQDLYICLVAFLASITSVLTPTWVFQGFTKNSILAIYSLIGRGLAVTVTILIVKNKSDLMLAIYIQAFFGAIIGVLCAIYVRNILKIKFEISRLTLNKMKQLYYEGYHNFMAFIFTLGHTYINPLLVKFFLGDVALGLYSTAEKVVSVLKQAFYPISQAFYAKMCILASDSKYNELIKSSKKIGIFFSGLCIIALILNFSIGDLVYSKIFGSEFQISGLVTLMIITQWIISIAIILVNLIIVPIGKSYILKRVYLVGILVQAILVIPLISLFAIKGLLVSVLITEVVLTLIFAFYLKIFFKSKNNKSIGSSI